MNVFVEPDALHRRKSYGNEDSTDLSPSLAFLDHGLTAPHAQNNRELLTL